MLTITKENHSAKNLVDMYKDGLIDFDLPMQRGYVWQRDKKSKLITSPLLGYPIPTLYANKVDRVFRIIDGQQRGKTIISYMLNKFSLSVQPPIEINGKSYDVSGKKFCDLPQELQIILEECNVDLYYGKNMTPEQEREMFIRLNSGKPLSAIEMTKVQVRSMNEVTELSKHSVFDKIINKRGREASQSASLVMQIYVALYGSCKCMLSSAIKKSLEKTEITLEQQEHIKKCLSVFEQVYDKICAEKSDITKRLSLVFKRKSHFVAFIYTIHNALEAGNCDVDILLAWAKHFFDTGMNSEKTTISDQYNLYLKEAMNSDESVGSRLRLMLNDYEAFINKQL